MTQSPADELWKMLLYTLPIHARTWGGLQSLETLTLKGWFACWFALVKGLPDTLSRSSVLPPVWLARWIKIVPQMKEIVREWSAFPGMEKANITNAVVVCICQVVCCRQVTKSLVSASLPAPALSAPYFYTNATNVPPPPTLCIATPHCPPTVVLCRSALQPHKDAFQHISADFLRDGTHLGAGLIPRRQAVSTAPPLGLNALVQLLANQTAWDWTVMWITEFKLHGEGTQWRHSSLYCVYYNFIIMLGKLQPG